MKTQSEIALALLGHLTDMDVMPGDCDKQQQGETISALLKTLVAYVSAVMGPVPMAHSEFIEMASGFMAHDFDRLNDLMEEMTPIETVREMRRHYRVMTLKEKANANLN